MSKLRQIEQMKMQANQKYLEEKQSRYEARKAEIEAENKKKTLDYEKAQDYTFKEVFESLIQDKLTNFENAGVWKRNYRIELEEYTPEELTLELPEDYCKPQKYNKETKTSEEIVYTVQGTLRQKSFREYCFYQLEQQQMNFSLQIWKGEDFDGFTLKLKNRDMKQSTGHSNRSR